MTTTIERAVRAVQDATAGEMSEEQNLRIARAVLLAVREPEIRFVYVGGALVGRSDMIFTAMIDAILNEPTA